ncbi:MAG TPA: hypothetical protein VHT68_06185, partial [Pseudolabrys sp.]|nr:hypothetical protein [Pseudolabrys sp.]
KTVTKIIFASAITLFAAAPAAFAQNMGWGNASTPGASVLKDDQSLRTTTVKNDHVSYTTRERASRSSSQTFGWGNASTPGAGVIKDDTVPYGK